jgi:transcriptional regulator with XRE-family HTH domain
MGELPTTTLENTAFRARPPRLRPPGGFSLGLDPGYRRAVTPDELKALRKELACTAKELAAAIGLEQSTVLAWEKGDLFPTNQYIDKMNALRAKGPGAIPKKSKGGDPIKQLTDPVVWELLRKIAAHKKLRDEVAKLAAGYPDPAEDRE